MKAIEKALKQIIKFPLEASHARKKVTGLMPDGQRVSVSYYLQIDLSSGLSEAVFSVWLDETKVWGNTQTAGGLTDEETAKLVSMVETACRQVDDADRKIANRNMNKFQEWISE